jgi:hypothetical protein
MILTISSIVLPDMGPVLLLNPILFYDAPKLAPGVFDDFLTIPTIGGVGAGAPFNTTTLRELVVSTGGGRDLDSLAPRAVFNTVGLTEYQPELLFSILNDTYVSILTLRLLTLDLFVCLSVVSLDPGPIPLQLLRYLRQLCN